VPPLRRFEGRNVIVTGGAQGIGLAIVDRFLSEGAHVFVADNQAERLGAISAQCCAPERIETYTFDAGDPQQAHDMVTEAIRRMGRVHVLVNCAGIMPSGGVLDVSQEVFDRTFAVNARGPFFTMQVAARHMVKHGQGAIVNVASTNAFRTESPEAPYNASKAALVALTKSYAHELGHLGVRANCVAPGQTITSEAASTSDDEDRRRARQYLGRIPMRRAGRSEEQAAAVLFLASDEASFISGETLVVDGGELTGDWYDVADRPPLPRD
jgi:NAD(P)-dependent dehydrogenase (short-subunit alcohol dehydrogenase family)